MSRVGMLFLVFNQGGRALLPVNDVSVISLPISLVNGRLAVYASLDSASFSASNTPYTFGTFDGNSKIKLKSCSNMGAGTYWLALGF